MISSQLRRTAAAPSTCDVAEDVRVAADQLLGAVVGDRGEVAGAALLEQQREEVHLEEHVAELVEQLRVVAAVRRVGELVGLVDGVGDDRALVLLAVPRAVAAQPPRQLVQPPDRARPPRRRSLTRCVRWRRSPRRALRACSGSTETDVAAAAVGARRPFLGQAGLQRGLRRGDLLLGEQRPDRRRRLREVCSFDAGDRCRR